MTSSISRNEKRFENDLNFHFKYFKFRNSKQLNEFMREDKMTSSNLEKESWKFQRNDLKVTLKLFEFPNFKSSWELFIFSTNYFTPKNKYMEIRVKYFPTIEN